MHNVGQIYLHGTTDNYCKNIGPRKGSPKIGWSLTVNIPSVKESNHDAVHKIATKETYFGESKQEGDVLVRISF